MPFECKAFVEFLEISPLAIASFSHGPVAWHRTRRIRMHVSEKGKIPACKVANSHAGGWATMDNVMFNKLVEGELGRDGRFLRRGASPRRPRLIASG